MRQKKKSHVVMKSLYRTILSSTRIFYFIFLTLFLFCFRCYFCFLHFRANVERVYFLIFTIFFSLFFHFPSSSLTPRCNFNAILIPEAKNFVMPILNLHTVVKYRFTFKTETFHGFPFQTSLPRWPIVLSGV